MGDGAVKNKSQKVGAALSSFNRETSIVVVPF